MHGGRLTRRCRQVAGTKLHDWVGQPRAFRESVILNAHQDSLNLAHPQITGKWWQCDNHGRDGTLHGDTTKHPTRYSAQTSRCADAMQMRKTHDVASLATFREISGAIQTWE